MLSIPRRTIFSLNSARVGGLAVIVLLSPAGLLGNSRSTNRTTSNVVCRSGVSIERRQDLAGKLRKISGWPNLEFDQAGILRQGTKEPIGGSRRARELLAEVILGTNAVVLEDVSRRPDVVFMRVVPGKWKHANEDKPPAFVVQIDFADFDQLMGDDPALEAFNVGWGLLHELDHIANDSDDAASLEDVGECETRINRMRRECDLPQRTTYFYTFSPLTRDTAFPIKLVRLAFEDSPPGATKKRRYWVLWDANLVGGLESQKQIAELR